MSAESDNDYLLRTRLGEYNLPDESEELIDAFFMQLRSAFSESAQSLWRITDEFADALTAAPEDNWTVDDFTEHINPAYMTAKRARRCFHNEISGLLKLADSHGIDRRPFLWFLRYIEGGRILSEQEQRDLLDSVSLLGLSVRGDDPETTPSSVDKKTAAVVKFLASKSPVTCTNEEIAGGTAKEQGAGEGAELAINTIRTIVTRLIKAGYAERPNGIRKGATLTSSGLSLAQQIGN